MYRSCSIDVFIGCVFQDEANFSLDLLETKTGFVTQPADCCVT